VANAPLITAFLPLMGQILEVFRVASVALAGRLC
jgi:hypothetical protein